MAIDSQKFKKYNFKRVIPQVRQTHCFALNSGIRVDLMLEWDL
ncbi:uncharacterized protein G2W53_010395 [Senna tora]|uniref:Uncharacterized protein n=1 Tax=Senna tora TaxID=362788 RepID=A0A834WZV7_9FABA|nr:uncharacterized protein G2W53_010395 [Senna tora]